MYIVNRPQRGANDDETKLHLNTHEMSKDRHDFALFIAAGKATLNLLSDDITVLFYILHNKDSGRVIEWMLIYSSCISFCSLFLLQTGKVGKCQFTAAKSVLRVDDTRGIWQVQEGDEYALQQAVAVIGPVTVAVYSALDTFRVSQRLSCCN